MSDLMLLYDYYLRMAETTYLYEEMRMFEQLARLVANEIRPLKGEYEDV